MASCLQFSIAMVKVLFTHRVLYIEVHQHGCRETDMHGKWRLTKLLYSQSTCHHTLICQSEFAAFIDTPLHVRNLWFIINTSIATNWGVAVNKGGKHQCFNAGEILKAGQVLVSFSALIFFPCETDGCIEKVCLLCCHIQSWGWLMWCWTLLCMFHVHYSF